MSSAIDRLMHFQEEVWGDFNLTFTVSDGLLAVSYFGHFAGDHLEPLFETLCALDLRVPDPVRIRARGSLPPFRWILLNQIGGPDPAVSAGGGEAGAFGAGEGDQVQAVDRPRREEAERRRRSRRRGKLWGT